MVRTPAAGVRPRDKSIQSTAAAVNPIMVDTNVCAGTKSKGTTNAVPAGASHVGQQELRYGHSSSGEVTTSTAATTTGTSNRHNQHHPAAAAAAFHCGSANEGSWHCMPSTPIIFGAVSEEDLTALTETATTNVRFSNRQQCMPATYTSQPQSVLVGSSSDNIRAGGGGSDVTATRINAVSNRSCAPVDNVQDDQHAAFVEQQSCAFPSQQRGAQNCSHFSYAEQVIQSQVSACAEPAANSMGHIQHVVSDSQQHHAPCQSLHQPPLHSESYSPFLHNTTQHDLCTTRPIELLSQQRSPVYVDVLPVEGSPYNHQPTYLEDSIAGAGNSHGTDHSTQPNHDYTGHYQGSLSANQQRQPNSGCGNTELRQQRNNVNPEAAAVDFVDGHGIYQMSSQVPPEGLPYYMAADRRSSNGESVVIGSQLRVGHECNSSGGYADDNNPNNFRRPCSHPGAVPSRVDGRSSATAPCSAPSGIATHGVMSWHSGLHPSPEYCMNALDCNLQLPHCSNGGHIHEEYEGYQDSSTYMCPSYNQQPPQDTQVMYGSGHGQYQYHDSKVVNGDCRDDFAQGIAAVEDIAAASTIYNTNEVQLQQHEQDMNTTNYNAVLRSNSMVHLSSLAAPSEHNSANSSAGNTGLICDAEGRHCDVYPHDSSEQRYTNTTEVLDHTNPSAEFSQDEQQYTSAAAGVPQPHHLHTSFDGQHPVLQQQQNTVSFATVAASGPHARSHHRAHSHTAAAPHYPTTHIAPAYIPSTASVHQPTALNNIPILPTPIRLPNEEWTHRWMASNLKRPAPPITGKQGVLPYLPSPPPVVFVPRQLYRRQYHGPQTALYQNQYQHYHQQQHSVQQQQHSVQQQQHSVQQQQPYSNISLATCSVTDALLADSVNASRTVESSSDHISPSSSNKSSVAAKCTGGIPAPPPPVQGKATLKKIIVLKRPAGGGGGGQNQNNTLLRNNSSSSNICKRPVSRSSTSCDIELEHSPEVEVAVPAGTATQDVVQGTMSASNSTDNILRNGGGLPDFCRNTVPSKPTKTLQQREQEYNAARKRIFEGVADLQLASSSQSALEPSPESVASSVNIVSIIAEDKETQDGLVADSDELQESVVDNEVIRGMGGISDSTATTTATSMDNNTKVVADVVQSSVTSKVAASTNSSSKRSTKSENDTKKGNQDTTTARPKAGTKGQQKKYSANIAVTGTAASGNSNAEKCNQATVKGSKAKSAAKANKKSNQATAAAQQDAGNAADTTVDATQSKIVNEAPAAAANTTAPLHPIMIRGGAQPRPVRSQNLRLL